jgi:O-antigen/teichoic acid export membrane protein
VAFSILLKFFQSGTGLLGLFLISIYFKREVQGYYYTFASLVALQSFVELGLTVVITNAASHEWSKLQVGATGAIEGDPLALSRLVSLGRFVFKYYAAAAALFFVFAGAGGYWFLSRTSTTGVVWQGPWLVHIAFSSVFLWGVPFLSLLEGCDQVAPVAKFRLVQAIVANCIFLVAIRAGANLWAAPVMSSMSALFTVGYLLVTRRNFFRPFFSPPAMESMSWRKEIWPMQWRLASQATVSYFMFSLFTPVVFHYSGAVEAGQMGMSLQLVSAVQGIATIWVAVKVPHFGILVARREFDALDAEWRKATFLSVCMMIVGILALFCLLLVVNAVRPGTLSRVVPPVGFAMLAFGGIFSLIGQSFSFYLRAHKKEVLMGSAFASAISMGILVWQLGSRYGWFGVCVAQLVVTVCVSFPTVYCVWRKYKKEWHEPASARQSG